MPAKKKKKKEDVPATPKTTRRSTKAVKQDSPTSTDGPPGTKSTRRGGEGKSPPAKKVRATKEQGVQGQKVVQAPRSTRQPAMRLTKPPPEGRVTRIDQNQAAALANVSPTDEMFDGATDFYLVEWIGTMPWGLTINDREIKDLDIESEHAIDTDDVPIGRCRLLDGDDEDVAAAFEPGAVVIFRGIVWCE